MTTTAPYHHGDLHAALSAEALAQVRARGADVVSLRAVAQAVGVSASAAYHHFPDKTALMQAVGERGAAELDRRVSAAAEGVEGDGPVAAVARMSAVGTAYIGFALDEPHLFRHVFGAECMAGSAAVGHGPGGPEKDSQAYRVLGTCLDDLQRLGLLRPERREGLDLLAWTSVHGFSSLVIEGVVPAEAAAPLLATLLDAVLDVPAPR